MKKGLILLILFILSLNAFSQNRITTIVTYSENKQFNIIVNHDKEVWVGLTINADSDSEINFKATKLKLNDRNVLIDVSKVHKYTNSVKRIISDPTTYAKNVVEDDGFPYIVSLWGKKVNVISCTINNGSPCQYCREKGYHLEGRLDRVSGIYQLNGGRVVKKM